MRLVGGGEPLDLAVFSAGIGGVAIAQTLGPLKHAVAPSQTAPAMKLEVRSNEDDLVLEQAGPGAGTDQRLPPPQR